MGWKKINGKWYYFEPVMATYSCFIDGEMHYFTEDGVWVGQE